jgi:hypothetical protein
VPNSHIAERPQLARHLLRGAPQQPGADQCGRNRGQRLLERLANIALGNPVDVAPEVLSEGMLRPELAPLTRGDLERKEATQLGIQHLLHFPLAGGHDEELKEGGSDGLWVASCLLSRLSDDRELGGVLLGRGQRGRVPAICVLPGQPQHAWPLSADPGDH